MQEAWVRAIRRLPGFRWDSTLRTWLCGFVVNGCRERWRTRDPVPLESIASPLVPSGEPAVDLERAITALPAGYRAVLVLHDVEGYTHDEIAGLLGIEAGTSKSQLSRARAAVRDWLRKGDDT